eukprot:356753-Chlamydomonas_euryale.AAC.5
MFSMWRRRTVMVVTVNNFHLRRGGTEKLARSGEDGCVPAACSASGGDVTSGTGPSSGCEVSCVWEFMCVGKSPPSCAAANKRGGACVWEEGLRSALSAPRHRTFLWLRRQQPQHCQRQQHGRRALQKEEPLPAAQPSRARHGEARSGDGRSKHVAERDAAVGDGERHCEAVGWEPPVVWCAQTSRGVSLCTPLGSPHACAVQALTPSQRTLTRSHREAWTTFQGMLTRSHRESVNHIPGNAPDSAAPSSSRSA